MGARTLGVGARIVAIALVPALAASGCAPLGAPGQAPGPGASGRSATTPASPAARAQVAHEYPAPATPAERATGAQASASQAVRVFVTAYINWSAATVTAQLQQLASHSVGQARAAVALAAAQTASDYELRRGGIANRGTVEAVAPLPGRAHRFVVVTRELTTATLTTAYQGLRPAWHVALATAARLAAGGWVVSGWQPET
jgi:hypothetical protein